MASASCNVIVVDDGQISDIGAPVRACMGRRSRDWEAERDVDKQVMFLSVFECESCVHLVPYIQYSSTAVVKSDIFHFDV